MMTEYFDVVDEDDNVIGRATRKECHSGSRKMHRAVFIFIFNSKGELLIQKRSMKKDLFPGRFTASASGHNDPGEDYEKTAHRELKEEIGVDTDLKYMGKWLYDHESEKEFNALFVGEYDGPFNIDKEEIDEIKFISLEKLKEDVKKNPDNYTPAFRMAVEKYFELKK